MSLVRHAIEGNEPTCKSWYRYRAGVKGVSDATTSFSLRADVLMLHEDVGRVVDLNTRAHRSSVGRV